MTVEGIAPWHMWGSEATVIVPHGNPITFNVQQVQQLARIHYKRPETWTFLFFAELIAGTDNGGASQLDCNFDLTIGVGRSSVTLKQFCNLRFDWTLFAPVNQPLFSSASPNKAQVAFGFPPTSNGVMTDFPADDVQCTCQLVPGGFTEETTVRVGAFFAPRTHIRPEWFRSNPDFRGGGLGGA
jgi:hypothetical protein